MASVQSTTGSTGVRISGSNAGYTIFRGSVKSTGYPFPIASFPFTSPPVRHREPSHELRRFTVACIPSRKINAGSAAEPAGFVGEQGDTAVWRASS